MKSWAVSLEQVCCNKWQKKVPDQLRKDIMKIAWILSHHLHLQWKLKLLAGNFTWGKKAKHCWVDINKLFVFKNLLTTPSNGLYTSSNFSRPYLNFHWRWSWWDRIQAEAIFWNIFNWFHFLTIQKLPDHHDY